MCENHINDTVRQFCAINSVNSNRKRNETLVIAGDIDIDGLISAIDATGYKAALASKKEYEKKTVFNAFLRK